MELIATSDQQLRHLGYHDPDLAPYFAGVFPSDGLPARPVKDEPRGYIVNIKVLIFHRPRLKNSLLNLNPFWIV